VIGFTFEDDTIERQLIAIAAANVGVFALVGGISGLVVVSKHTGITLRRLMEPLGRPIVAGLVAFGVVAGANWVGVSAIDAPFIRLLITGTTGTVVAGLALVAVDPTARGYATSGLEKVRG
jgi:hypothetical protein